MQLLHANIPGQPKAKGRARAFVMKRQKGSDPIRIGHYTPKDTTLWEDRAIEAFRLAAPRELELPLDEPLFLSVLAIGKRPKRLMRKKDPDGRMYRTTKPDWDNVGKAVSDALVSGGIIRDDVLIVRGTVACYYAAKNEGPSVDVVLSRAVPMH